MKHMIVVLYGNESKKAVSAFIQRNESYAQWIANLLNAQFLGTFDPHVTYNEPVYYVPARTLVMSLQEAKERGITSSDDFLGGIVPESYIGTKAITHQVVAHTIHKPASWSHRFADAVKEVVLPGFSVFHNDDARPAASHLFKQGEVRFKPALGRSGRGQAVVHTLEELEHRLSQLGSDELQTYGVVLERQLDDISTLSVGTLSLEGEHISYYGQQRTTVNNQGNIDYGGSDLYCIRGTFDQLLQLDIPEHIRLAIKQAIIYDRARHHYPGLLASRRNYDIGQGYDHKGNFYSGVLEHSWRIGGATGAELYALEYFRKDATITFVEASTHCVFGLHASLPSHARIQFDGRDSDFGPMKVYTVVGKILRGMDSITGCGACPRGR
jgi:hypothetical protein